MANPNTPARYKEMPITSAGGMRVREAPFLVEVLSCTGVSELWTAVPQDLLMLIIVVVVCVAISFKLFCYLIDNLIQY